uniref:Uncharacterized protein n=1 Tax=Setaria italica TaxID=4555 RepID=K3YDL1_SETIT
MGAVHFWFCGATGPCAVQLKLKCIGRGPDSRRVLLMLVMNMLVDFIAARQWEGMLRRLMVSCLQQQHRFISLSNCLRDLCLRQEHLLTGISRANMIASPEESHYFR